MKSNEQASLESFVLSIIRQRGAGAGAAISVVSLAGRAGSFFSRSFSRGEIRGVIHSLRDQGQPICSCPSGYFWPADLQDVLDCVNSVFRGPARDQLRTSMRMKIAGRRLFAGQMELL
jgi:hypothetical protein